MKKGFSALLILSAIGTTVANAVEYSGNIGWASEYVYRGIPQNDSSASFGFDAEHEGFYAGTWAADVGQGAEVDLYFGYTGEVRDFSYGIGATGYFYTDDFDDTYKELNLSLGYEFVTADVAIGTWDAFDAPSQDYIFLSITAEHEGFHLTAGSFSQDFDGEYVEFGYGTEIATVDVGIAWNYGTSKLLGGDSNNTIILTVGKSFSLAKK